MNVRGLGVLLRGLVCAVLMTVFAGVHAADPDVEAAPAVVAPATVVAPLAVKSGRQGYAHDDPQMLLRQKLFGLAHGVSMLAAACLDLPAYSMAIQDAYAAWHERQAEVIELLVKDLSRHYFGDRAGEARWQDVARALSLKDSILPSLGTVTIDAACASLPQALVLPRYDFAKLLADSLVPEPEKATPK